MERVLVIGAHFDDIEIGVGGTLLKHVQNSDHVCIAILDSKEFRTGNPEIRYEEQLESLKLLNIDSSYLLTYEQNINEDDIVGKLDVIKPTIVYAPYEKDTHQSHRRASIIAQAVGRKKNITTLFYDCGSSYEFYPNMFSLIDFEKKIELINCYKTQLECNAIKLDIIKAKESYYASLISGDPTQYAEGFIVRKMIYKIGG